MTTSGSTSLRTIEAMPGFSVPKNAGPCTLFEVNRAVRVVYEADRDGVPSLGGSLVAAWGTNNGPYTDWDVAGGLDFGLVTVRAARAMLFEYVPGPDLWISVLVNGNGFRKTPVGYLRPYDRWVAQTPLPGGNTEQFDDWEEGALWLLQTFRTKSG